MTEEVVLITYSEIGIKSPATRRALEYQLARHLATSLKRRGSTDTTVRRIQGRLIVEGGNPDVTVETASKVFGVTSAIHAIKVPSELDTIIQTALDMALGSIKADQTFAVRARRVGKHAYSSRDIEAEVGEAILNHLKRRRIKVNLSEPDVIIQMEIRDNDAYLYRKTVKGPSGLPFGSQGRLIGLFSGGIDSPVAAWFMMKRGANVSLLFLDQRPFVGDDYYERALTVAEKLRPYIPLKHYALHIVPMGEVMEELVKNVPVKLTCVVCKRMMYRIACDLADRMNADGIMTGESLGQVASQTLANLKVLDEVATFPVYRPLIGFEKMEIVAWAKKIGTYQASTTPVCGCSVVPNKPATKAKLEHVLAAEKNMSLDRLINYTSEKRKRIQIC